MPRFLTLTAQFIGMTIFVCGVVTLAQPAKPPNPRQILDRGVIAMGGKEKLKAIRSRHAVGTIKRLSDGATGRYELITQFPSWYFSRLELGAEFEQVALNRLSAYEWSSAHGVRNLHDEELYALCSLAEYKNGYWYRDEIQRMSGKARLLFGAVSFGAFFFVPMDDARRNHAPLQLNKPLHSVTFDSLSSLYASLYFDQADGRLAAEELIGSFRVKDQLHDRKELFVYDDYRPVDGVLEPHFIQYTKDNAKYEIRLERVVHNQFYAESKFDVPPETQTGLPPLADVLAKATVSQEKLLSSYDQFQYLEKYLGCETWTDSDGNETSPCRERKITRTVNFHRGFPVKRLDYDSWYRLNPNKEQRRFEKEISKVDRIIAEKARQGKMPKDANAPLQHPGLLEFGHWGWGKAVYEALKQSTFRNYRRDTIAGRECFAIDFSQLKANRSAHEQAGTLWIDAKEFVVYRMDSYSIRLPNPGTPPYKAGAFDYMTQSFPGRLAAAREFVQAPVCEGLWLPKSYKDDGKITFTLYERNGKPLPCIEKTVIK